MPPRLTEASGWKPVPETVTTVPPMVVSVDRVTATGCRYERGSATIQVLDALSHLRFYSATPCRMVDTRLVDGDLGGPALAPSTTRVFPLGLSSCGIPAGARTISANVTVTGPTAPGYLSMYAADQAQPVATTLNFRVGQTRANNAMLTLALDGTGGVKALNGSMGSVHLIIDVNGYFQ